jgi:hypothetical protein
MSGAPRLRTVVADTSALVSLAVPRAAAEYDTEANPDPLRYLLTSCDVFVPPEVVAELRNVADYDDVHGTAASNVLAADSHYTVEDPYRHDDGPDDRPEFGLDRSETDGIALANARTVDGFLTDEFGGTNFAFVHAALSGPRIVPAPRLVVDYARGGHLSHADARDLVGLIGSYRSRDDNPYVSILLDQLE